MKLTKHYRDSLDNPICTECAGISILKLTTQEGVEEPTQNYEPLECAGCFNLILLEDEAEANSP